MTLPKLTKVHTTGRRIFKRTKEILDIPRESNPDARGLRVRTNLRQVDFGKAFGNKDSIYLSAKMTLFKPMLY